MTGHMMDSVYDAKVQLCDEIEQGSKDSFIAKAAGAEDTVYTVSDAIRDSMDHRSKVQQMIGKYSSSMGGMIVGLSDRFRNALNDTIHLS